MMVSLVPGTAVSLKAWQKACMVAPDTSSVDGCSGWGQGSVQKQLKMVVQILVR